MGIAKILFMTALFFSGVCWLGNVEAADTESAIKEIIEKLTGSHLLRDAKLCEDDVFKREKVFSTCIPGGIALPHARTAVVSRLLSTIAISRKGVEPATVRV